MNVLHNHNMKQIVTAFDLVCTNNPAFIHKVEVVFWTQLPLAGKVQLAQWIQPDDPGVKTIKWSQKADGEAFREDMQKTIEKLKTKKDPEAMGHLFTDCLTQSINNHVSTKEMKPQNTCIPEWFNKWAMKTSHEQRKAYHKTKSPSSDFGLNRYKETRTTDRNQLEVIRWAY